MKIFRTLAIAALSFTLFTTTSCKKEETTPGTPPDMGLGTLLFDGTSYKIGGALGEDYGQGSWHDGYNIDLTLYSDGIVEQGDSLTGNGLALYFETLTPTEMMFEPGTYSYSVAGPPSPVFTFTDFSLIYVGDVNNGGTSGTTYDLDPSSKFTVTKNGDVYTIVFSVSATSGETLSGTFTGMIPII